MGGSTFPDPSHCGPSPEEGEHDNVDSDEKEEDSADCDNSAVYGAGSNPDADADDSQSGRTRVNISRRKKPTTATVITVHSIPTTASAARADLFQKRLIVGLSAVGTPIGHTTKFELTRNKRITPTSNYSAKYVDDSS